MIKVLILALICIHPIALSLKCPVFDKQKSIWESRPTCWDNSGGSMGCCASETPCWKAVVGGFQCDCETRCKGWAVEIAESSNFQFVNKPFADSPPAAGVEEEYGADTLCSNVVGGRSMRTMSQSCVDLWEKEGCTGKKTRVDGGSISNIADHGFPEIRSISQCTYTAPTSVDLTLYQNAFWSFFGYTKDITVRKNQCTKLDDWWKDRTSMIRTDKGNQCFKIWKQDDCTGIGECACAWSTEWTLRNYNIRDTSTTWNNNVRSLSLCDYGM